MATRIGVDVGGTFTDLIAYDDASGAVVVVKEPTTLHAPEQGVLAAVARGVSAELVRASEYFLHGTTVGLNALLERRGAVVGLLCTRGFRDVLEIRRGDRADAYDLLWIPPPPLVPRHLRLPVSGRMLADGTIRTPLDPGDVRGAASAFSAAGVTAVAIAFMNAYANPEHELEAERELRKAGFEGDISLSHRVSGEYREYERTCTTVIDAFVRGRMGSYLQRLEKSLGYLGFSGDALVTRSGGGSLPFAEAQERPFETILSGPVAGAQGAAELARMLGIDRVISADVGGTSFDTCLISDGRPSILYEGCIVGLPVQSPWVDVRSIGAGGGSIAYVDRGGLLRVGPHSAGANPGPACYGRGGTEGTVTDAAVVLGMLGDGRLAGDMRLEPSLARDALEPFREALGFTSVDDVARGMLIIATANMANAIREITVERGEDPREATLLSFGGAGPLFAGLLARELDIHTIVVPPHAGSFSAWGLLGSDVTRSAARTRIVRLDESGIAVADSLASSLFAQLEPEGPNSRSRDVGLDLRYRGQEHSLTITVPTDAEGRLAADAEQLRSVFAREYERTFAHAMEEEIEIVSVRASTTAVLPPRELRSPQVGDPSLGAPDVTAFSFSLEERVDFRVIDRRALEPTEAIVGPALIMEETATTYVDAGFVVRLHDSGALFIHDERGTA